MAIEAAAEEHKNGIHDNPGSDAFRWALLLCVGYGCWENPSRAEYHGITVAPEDINLWLFERREWIGKHDGDVDYIGLLAGVYDPLAEE